MDAPADTEVTTLTKALQRLLNATNRVTAPHRHGNLVSIRDLDNLSNVQIDVEKELQK